MKKVLFELSKVVLGLLLACLTIVMFKLVSRM